MRPDFLGGLPMRGTTTVPGYFLLEIPSVSTPSASSLVHIRRYRATANGAADSPESSADAVRRARVEELLRGDALEGGWRRVNGEVGAGWRCAAGEGRGEGGAGKGGSTGLRRALMECCGVVVPPRLGRGFKDNNAQAGQEEPRAVRGEVTTTWSQQRLSLGERLLWCFSASDPAESDVWPAHEGLEEILPRLEPLDPQSMLDCSKHGQSYSCLTTPPRAGEACDVVYCPPSEDVRLAWEYLASALVERIAWDGGRGRRLCTSAGGMGTGLGPPYNVSLTPRKANQLLLAIRHRRARGLPRTALQITSDRARQQLRPLLLQPLRLPALELGPFQASAAQHTRLSEVFNSALGSSWKDGQRGSRLSAQLAAAPWSEWSVYWVPTVSAIPSDKPGNMGNNQTAQPAAEWQQTQGVITIWPTHLVSDLASSSTAASTANSREPDTCASGKRKQDVSAAFTAPRADELMSSASSFFDFLGSYREPDLENPPGIPTEVSEAEPDLAELTPDTSLNREGLLPEDGTGPGSDGDDLFSSRSTSPVETTGAGRTRGEKHQQDPRDPNTRGPEADDLDDLFGGAVDGGDGGVELDKDEEMASPPRADVELTGMDGYGQDDMAFAFGDETNVVTEDDFNFFDSPAQGLIEQEGDETVQTDVNQEREPKEEERLSPRGAGADEEELSVKNTSGGEAQGPKSSLLPVKSPSVVTGDDRVHAPGVHFDESSHPLTAQQHLETNLPSFNVHDIIPSPFEPINLSPSAASNLPSFAYTFPSPAPTPQALRSDLVDRLKPAKKTRYDYAANWGIEEEVSEQEDEESEEYSGAPPTPESEDDYEDSSKSAPSVKNETDKGGDDEVRWEGIRCIGAEWFWIKDDPEAVALLGRGWNPDWVSVTQGGVPLSFPLSPAITPSAAPEGFLATIDCDRLAMEIISNRHFRKLLLEQEIPHASEQYYTVESWLKAGASLNQLLTDDEDSVSDKCVHQMPTCDIHSGFAGKVMRLALPGVKYWTQLGLSPVGGRKDVRAVVVCDEEEGSRRAARELLQGVGRAYEELRLGKHTLFKSQYTHPEAGLMSSSAASSPGYLEELVYRGGERLFNLVIYVLFNQSTAAISSPALQFLFKPRDLAPTCVIHVISTSFLQSRNYQTLALDVYDRIPREIKRVDFYGAPEAGPVYMQYPSFTLAPDQPPKISLSLAWPLRSYDLLNKWRLVHGAYGYEEKSGMMVAYVIDSEGENFEVKTWRIGGAESDEESQGTGGKADVAAGRKLKTMLEKVWEFFSDFAEVAAIEWRLTVCKLGLMSQEETESWRDIPKARTSPLTLAMIDPPSSSPPHSGLTGFRPRPGSSHITTALMSDPNTRVIDETLSAQVGYFGRRIPIDLPTRLNPGEPPAPDPAIAVHTTLFPRTSFVLSIASQNGHASSMYHVLSHRPAPGKADEKIEEVLAREFYRLTCLGRERFGFEGAGLPLHLESVRAVMVGMRL